MKFLCLCYYDADALARLSPSEAQAIGADCEPHDRALRATGKVTMQGSLSSPDTWVHFVPKDGRPVERSGPYLTGSRHSGAFFVVDADNADEAKRVASKHAAANIGEHLGFAVEVRACDKYETY